MRGLKALVIGMGILIAVGVVFLVYAIIQKAGEEGISGGSAVNTQVTIPAGAEVIETSLGDGRIALRLRMPDGSGRLLLLDAASGEPIGKIELKSK